MEKKTEYEYPPDFRCPISMEVMKDPVTIATGFSYDRKSIEKWFNVYNKKTCPATMKRLPSLEITPNHTLKRLIISWQENQSAVTAVTPSSSPLRPCIKHDEIVSLLTTLQSSPFKVTSLKKIRSVIERGDDNTRSDFIKSGGIEAVIQILVNNHQNVIFDGPDFIGFQACEEALGLLHLLPLTDHEDEKTFQLLSKPEPMKSIAIVLQRGGAEARLYAIKVFRQIAKTDFDWNLLIQDNHGTDLFKSLLDLVYDEIGGGNNNSKASSWALEVLIEILASSKKTRSKAIEAGAVCVLVELLPDSTRSKCEKMLLLIKLLCKCAEGRTALAEHSLGIAAVSKKLLHVSNAATKLAVKILWLMCGFQYSSTTSERVLEEMLVYGAVKKMVALIHLEGRSSTKEKVVKMFKLHCNAWRRFPCFPCDLKDYLGCSDNR